MLTSRVDVFFFYLGLGDQDDPFEKKDVAWAFPDKAKQMITRIEELERSACVHPFQFLPSSSIAAHPHDVRCGSCRNRQHACNDLGRKTQLPRVTFKMRMLQVQPGPRKDRPRGV